MENIIVNLFHINSVSAKYQMLKALKTNSCISFFVLLLISALSCNNPERQKSGSFNIPEGYLTEPESIPPFWIDAVDDVNSFLKKNITRGQVEVFGTSAGGRPLNCVLYGKAREGRGTTTFSGSLGFGDVRVYRGPGHSKKVYLGMGAVHGGEFEGIVGIVNLISVLETGKDMRGREWPRITEAASKLDRIILIPIMNPDGRARVPLRMEIYRGASNTVYEYLNTGGKPDGTLIGWPQVKEFIPLDFKNTSFPGGYPNDAGVNIMHDDFFGKRQPETQALFDLTEREKPDLILNMHTGAPPKDYYIRMHRPFAEPALNATYEALYRKVHSALAIRGLQGTTDPETEADPKRSPQGEFNLDAALNLHCGALSVVIESPCHGFSGTNRAGEIVLQTPEMILDAQLICHEEAMKFLAETGGRSHWTPGRGGE